MFGFMIDTIDYFIRFYHPKPKENFVGKRISFVGDQDPDGNAALAVLHFDGSGDLSCHFFKIWKLL